MNIGENRNPCELIGHFCTPYAPGAEKEHLLCRVLAQTGQFLIDIFMRLTPFSVGLAKT